MELLDILIFGLAAVLLCLWGRHSPFPVSAVPHRPKQRLPPGPPGWPLVGNLLQVILQNRPFIYVIRDLRAKYGPIFTMKMGQRPLVIVTSSQLIHEALVQRGPLFATRPPDSPTRLVFSVGKCAINSAEYGPLWRTLRRNFVTELINPARIRQCAWIRRWAIKDHFERLEREGLDKGYVEVMSNCRLTICSILICLCFGAKISVEKIKHIEGVLKEVMMMTTPKLPDFLPVLTPLFRGQLKAARELRKRQMECLVPLIRERKAFVESGGKASENGGLGSGSCLEMLSPLGAAYVDSLLGLKPARRELGDQELVTLCSEVISAGTDTSATTMERALLHLVQDQDIQPVYDEIAHHMVKDGLVNETDVKKMTYLSAVVKEMLWRHPLSHFLLSFILCLKFDLLRNPTRLKDVTRSVLQENLD